MSSFSRRPVKVMLLAAAVTGLIGASTGLALAADTRSAQVAFCGSGADGMAHLRGVNERGESAYTNGFIFPASGCVKAEGYWWSTSPSVEFVLYDETRHFVTGTCDLGNFNNNDVVNCKAPAAPPVRGGGGVLT